MRRSRRSRRAATGSRRPSYGSRGAATLGVRPGNHGERGERAGERERQAQRCAAGGRSEQPSGSAAIAALPRIVRRSRHGYPDSLLGTMTAVAVTGIGVVSAFGHGVEPFWRGLTAGACGLRPIRRFEMPPGVALGGEVPPLERRVLVLGGIGRHIVWLSLMALAACRLALV